MAKFGEGKLRNPNISPDIKNESGGNGAGRFHIGRPMFLPNIKDVLTCPVEPTRVFKSGDFKTISGRSTFCTQHSA